MEQTYILTSTKFTGKVVYTFSESGFLLKYDTTGAQLTDEQLLWISDRMPRNLELFKQALSSSKTKTYKLELQKTANATFEMFWNRYNAKSVSSKKKSQTIWNRLSQVQRDFAYNFIPEYERRIPSGIAKKYAETYLNSEIWNN